MNSVLYGETDAALNECDTQSDMRSMNTSMNEESYVTAPMMAIVRPGNTTDEELHDLFEAAISDRLLAMREQMERISGPLSMSHKRSMQTEALHPYEAETLTTFKAQLANMYTMSYRWQHVLLFVCLGLMLAMLGFDVMGLLILAAQ